MATRADSGLGKDKADAEGGEHHGREAQQPGPNEALEGPNDLVVAKGARRLKVPGPATLADILQLLGFGHFELILLLGACGRSMAAQRVHFSEKTSYNICVWVNNGEQDKSVAFFIDGSHHTFEHVDGLSDPFPECRKALDGGSVVQVVHLQGHSEKTIARGNLS